MKPVGKAKCDKNIKQCILDAVQQIGGIGEFVKPGETVMLKPNFNTADPYPASTDMDFLKAVVEICYGQGAKMVMVADSSTMSLNTRKVMEKKGVFELEKSDPPVRVYNLDEREWVKKEIPTARTLKSVSIPRLLERPDKLIFLPCLKTHFQAQYTGALKLSVGLMKPIQRVGLHLIRIEEQIAELSTLIHPDLVIMDSRKIFISGGPSHGDLAEPGIIMASAGRVAIDIEGVKLIQSFKGNSLAKINAEELPQIKRALELGIE